MLERLHETGGPEFFTARGYTPNINMGEYDGRIFYNNILYGDIAQPKKGTKKELELLYTDVYRLVDILYPELRNRGLKAEGYVKYSVLDLKRSRIIL